MILKCIAVDDEPPALDLICSYIEQTPFLELIDRSNSALEILERLDPGEVDLIFLDIEMPDLSGINFSKILKQGPKIIFTTAYDEYAIEGYKVEALDYLLKPISYEEFLEAAQKGKEYAQLIRAASGRRHIQRSYLFVRSEYKLVKVDFEDILYIEGLKDYVKFHLESTKTPLLTLMSLKGLENELPEHSFMRAHRSYIVNLNKIESVERRIIHFSRGEARFSEQYSEKFLERINTA